MLSEDDLAQMRSDTLIVRDDKPISINLRRGGADISAQTVRLAARGSVSGSRMSSNSAEENRSGVIVLGDTDLDILVDDRFTVSDMLYRVVFVEPDRSVCTTADAEVVE